MTYEDALNHVRSRRPVLPHVGLRETVYRMYPRPWAPHLATRSTSTSTVYSEDVVPEPEVVEEPPAPEVVSAAASESKTEIPAAAQKSRSDVAEERATGPDKVEAPAPQGQVPTEEPQTAEESALPPPEPTEEEPRDAEA